MSHQLKEHALHAEELSSALEQAKAALSSQQTEALSQLQAETQKQSQELQQRMQELQDQVGTLESVAYKSCVLGLVQELLGTCRLVAKHAATSTLGSSTP